ncbi:MAG: valine--tRNA ligase [Prevotellaceae bacterium]|jgi:valyl-tRNA synthetase|nr:valine--tRNA ligase [Prevotellaceae bacterium]
MEITAKYNPVEVEDRLYAYWMGNGFFNSDPDQREPYTIVIPPPNVTGVLHMGHMLNNTIQDVLVRRARMLGKNACWVPGTDHASIATEAKVVAKLREQGISKDQLSRNEFLKHAWDWKEKHGGIILEQLKKLGASCDWRRTRFTMDEKLSEAVINTFIYLYNKGLIYRGVRMVNWDPISKTAVSDEEVIHKDVNSKLYYLSYPIVGENASLTIATTRPETIMADVAICINPKDERYSRMKGKKVLIPLINKEIPVIFDEYVSMDFGTGCLKVTPAHDVNDYTLGIKYSLPVIDIIDNDGRLNEKAQILVGEDRFDARRKIVKMLDTAGLLVKTEDYKSSVGFSERTDAVIEPKLSMQWFLKMEEISKPALNYVLNGDIKLIPDKFKNTYKYWMENVRDWCISRQLWWGQRIPAWYLPDGNFVVAKTVDEAFALAQQKYANINIADLHQDEDVVDTWFSSWLWPLSVFDPAVCGHPEAKGNSDLNYYYPTNDLVTAPEILFFWVARMIIAGHEFRGKAPFSNVYLTGIVRDKEGRKMSKSLGNSPDPLELIKQYGADGVRVGMLLCSSAGNDILYDNSQVEQGRNFCNKIWNAFRLIKSWNVEQIPQPYYASKAIEWFNSQFNKTLKEIYDNFDKYRISEALMDVYKLFWDDFCAYYLEIIKPAYGSPVDKSTYSETLKIFENLLKILHPFMPFITEEIWLILNNDKNEERKTIMLTLQPKPCSFDEKIVETFEQIKEIIINVRALRQNKNISPKQSLDLFVKGNFDLSFANVLMKLANLAKVEKIEADIENASSFRVSTNEYYIPLGNKINIDEELKKLENELEYAKGFLSVVNKKLSNDKFVNSAPSNVVESERKKQSDAESKIKILEENIARLQSNNT